MNNTKHKRLLQILLLLLTVCVVLFIFSNSRENAAESSSRSQQLTRFINYALRSVNLPWRVTEHLVRKAAHFLEYALLGFFVALTAASFTARKLLRGMIAFPACLLVAFLISAGAAAASALPSGLCYGVYISLINTPSLPPIPRMVNRLRCHKRKAPAADCAAGALCNCQYILHGWVD